MSQAGLKPSLKMNDWLEYECQQMIEKFTIIHSEFKHPILARLGGF